MNSTRLSFWTLLLILPCSVVAGQDTPKEALEARTEPQTQELSTDVPEVHITRLRHASAKELELSLGKIFDSQIKAGQLAIIADVRSNRLIVRSGDELCARVNQLVAELDIESPDKSPSSASLPGQSLIKDPVQNSNLSNEQQKLQNIIRDSKLAGNDPAKVQWIRELLTSTVEREFAEQQEELRSELTKLRAKVESLEALLEKRNSQKNQICQKRVESLLSSQAPSGAQSVTQDSLFSAPRNSTNSILSPNKTRRNVPLQSNAKISADNIAEEITTILQAELIGEEGMKVSLKGKPKLVDRSILFQLDNRSGQVEYELLSGDEKRMMVRVKLECQDAGQEFWERISGDNIRLSVTLDDVERVIGGQLVTKSVYLPKESGKGQATLKSYEMEAGTDVREAAKQRGQPIVTMTLTRLLDYSAKKTDTQEWQHSYGSGFGGSKEVQAYYLDLVEYCKLRTKLRPQDPKIKEVVNRLVSNTATNDAIHRWANPHRTELLKHVAAQKALSAIDEVASKEIGLLVNALSKLETAGREELEKMFQHEQDSNSRDVCFVNDSDLTTVFTVISGTERFEKRLKPHTHSYVTLDTTFDDRVVLVQTVDESSKTTKAPPMKVVNTKVLADQLDLRWNFCFVHSSEKEAIRMDLLGYVCLDVVPLKWHEEPPAEDFSRIKSQLLASLKSTEEEDSNSTGALKDNLRLFNGVK